MDEYNIIRKQKSTIKLSCAVMCEYFLNNKFPWLTSQ